MEGHVAHTPDDYIKEIKCIVLTMAMFDSLEVKAEYIVNDYVMALNIEKRWTVLGPEFGDDAGKSAIIVTALYGLKCVDALFRAHLA